MQELLPGLISGEYPPRNVFPEPQIRYWTGPSSGHLHHQPLDGLVEWVSAGNEWFYNLEASASFANPYSAAVGDFSFGFDLRSDPFIRVFVKSNGTWWMMSWNGSQWTDIASGPAALFDGAGDWNHLSVILSGQYASVWLNDQRLEDGGGNTLFQLPSGTTWGSVDLVIGLVPGDERANAITEYWGFTVNHVTGYGSSSEPSPPAATESGNQDHDRFRESEPLSGQE